ncbi:MAG: hypothetical protein HY758_05885, partial [Nitrospirae bacterium]|nr:hypothetical protein [Nitrospirota bacterium]
FMIRWHSSVIRTFPTRSAHGECGAERCVRVASAPRVENKAHETDSPGGAAQRRIEAVEKGLSEKLRELEQKNGRSECVVLNDLG